MFAIKALPLKTTRRLTTILFLLPLAIYFYKFYDQALGADLLWRVTEAKYFLAKINPYDVFAGVKPVIPAYGPKPAAYSFFSYFFAGALVKVTNNPQLEILIFICIDYLALVLGIHITNRIAKRTASSNAIVLATLLCSTFYWQHIYFLNFTILATLGALLLVYGQQRNLTLVPLIGMSLIGLRPSLAIPVFLYLLIGRHWKIFALSALEYLIVLTVTSVWLGDQPFALVKQLSDTQRHFSDALNFYHSEGMLLAFKGLLGSYMTAGSVVIATSVFVYFRKFLADPVISLVLILTISVSLFYTQVHGWICIYPVLLISLQKDLAFKMPTIIPALLIGFLLVPRLSGLVPEQAVYQYVVIQNIIRFGILWYCTLRLIQLLKSKNNHGNSENTPKSPAITNLQLH